ncbi:uncharacterized protein LOC131681900 [Topomyia yanbarensis]|uniref:uncharacterized protein LOC131681900 n=1 Tax=Topomyia yanbarensis TaxID=2498891 RepID=UPI00273CC675|nr:uncharacterized protein LOC131681900 [Topomyia yanbarensis]XP_058818983.1 uncharacterized protein LOC131681900 [Topomyia yanbarensis]
MKLLSRLMGLLLLLLVAFDAVSYTNAFIVPEELPSILSLVYSNIPPIRKGTDSRVGFGFRLGDHADFQVQFEIGPQQRTRPIGTNSGSSKRNVESDDYQPLKLQAGSSNLMAGKSWLETWSKETKQKQQFNKDKHRDATKTPEMPESPMIAESAYNQLQQLFGMNKPKEEDTIGTIPGADLEAALKHIPFKPIPTSDTDINEVDPKVHNEVTFKPLPVETKGKSKVDSVMRRAVRKRTSPSAKDKISADLSDVSLD